MTQLIIITDLRNSQILAALSLLRQSKGQATAIFNLKTLTCFDYGTNNLSKLDLLWNVFVLWISGVTFINARLRLSNHTPSVACTSSLISLTEDYGATPESYPFEWSKIVESEIICLSTLNHIKKLSYDSIYVFNGRLASSYLIVKSSIADSIPVLYYEGSPNRNHFGVVNFLPSDILSFGRHYVVAYINATDPFPLRQELGKRFLDKKLRNPFAVNYVESSIPRSVNVLFLGSPHENYVIDDCYDVSYLSDPEAIEAALSHLSRNEVLYVRLHPNSIRDPSILSHVSELKAAFAGQSVNIIEPSSTISSHAMIREAKRVFVTTSSIAVDSYFLGKVPIFLGDSEFKPIIEYINALPMTLDERHRELGYAIYYAHQAYSLPVVANTAHLLLGLKEHAIGALESICKLR